MKKSWIAAVVLMVPMGARAQGVGSDAYAWQRTTLPYQTVQSCGINGMVAVPASAVTCTFTLGGSASASGFSNASTFSEGSHATASGSTNTGDPVLNGAVGQSALQGRFHFEGGTPYEVVFHLAINGSVTPSATGSGFSAFLNAGQWSDNGRQPLGPFTDGLADTSWASGVLTRSNISGFVANGSDYTLTVPLTVPGRDLFIDMETATTSFASAGQLVNSSTQITIDSVALLGMSGTALPGADYTFMATSALSTPEPSSLALLGTGLVGLVSVMRRKRTVS